MAQDRPRQPQSDPNIGPNMAQNLPKSKLKEIPTWADRDGKQVTRDGGPTKLKEHTMDMWSVDWSRLI